MAIPLEANYKLEYNRYRHYFHRLWVYYQKPVAKVSGALLLTLFTIIFFAAFAIRPTLVTVAELIKKIDDQQAVLTKMKEKSAALASAQQEYLVAQERIAKLNTAVPPQEDVKTLIKLIESTATYHQAPWESVGYGDVSFLDASAPRLSGPQSRNLVLSTTASYDTLRTLLTNLLHLPQLISIKSAALTPEDAQSTTDNLQLNLSLQTHFLPK